MPGVDPGKTLLSALWDLIRNGAAHEYQDIIVELKGGKWALGIKGVKHNVPLSEVEKNRSSWEHLSYKEDSRDLILYVHPAVLFLDIRNAADNAKLRAGITKGTLTINHLKRPREKRPPVKPGQTTYNFDMSELKKKLSSNNFTLL